MLWLYLRQFGVKIEHGHSSCLSWFQSVDIKKKRFRREDSGVTHQICYQRYSLTKTMCQQLCYSKFCAGDLTKIVCRCYFLQCQLWVTANRTYVSNSFSNQGRSQSVLFVDIIVKSIELENKIKSFDSCFYIDWAASC